MADIDEITRAAFDSDSFAEKNIALRKAHGAIVALREERDRLREALEDIARRCEARSELYTSDEDMAANLISHARATLAATGEEER